MTESLDSLTLSVKCDINWPQEFQSSKTIDGSLFPKFFFVGITIYTLFLPKCYQVIRAARQSACFRYEHV